ncbi:aminotransferase class I/II-fold pyridoxal phosphate-dependent enzyme [Virgibacillus siamensis]|uniref:aminotransferase class I/II-fold pyridoxal phosphate-dependent enzyme n=1 Tax=Virgibacillus siamensis TaxID=480071 RepID=UPI000985868F|nr:aminotransferase class I/II-fold pyridoxal phosphate-dependent enzyme [Virgibacillus siamensis]
MKRNQQDTPLFDALQQFTKRSPTSFHVPGHKNGELFPDFAREFYQSILPVDLTELPGLDDLHAPQDVIKEAQELAADFFGVEQTHFLVGGSTAGNIAMVLGACNAGDEIIVQRNSHKSVFNGLELSGARPIFIAPEFDAAVDRYTAPDINTLKKALKQHPDVKAVMLTYPDYFGQTFALKEMIGLAHEYNIPVLVDEAHGVHFSTHRAFPVSSLEFGADAVVQSAHKMAPAMTMGSFLHVNTAHIANNRITHYLQMLQSSSPSYPIMASLDLARWFLANLKTADIEAVLNSVRQVKEILQAGPWQIPLTDDPLKITLHMEEGLCAREAAGFFENIGIYPELATHNQILLIHGLTPFRNVKQLKKGMARITEQLKNTRNRATIDLRNLFTNPIEKLAMPYGMMQHQQTKQILLEQSAGCITAEAIVPYPPGVPFVLRGERITESHISMIKQLIQQGATIQHHDIIRGISVFK